MTNHPMVPATLRLDDLIDGLRRAHPDDVLDQLAGAVVLADHLGEVADHLIGHFVDQARRTGASWTDIGRSLGVTKQAAQKRFVPKTDSEPTPVDMQQGFARFTMPARNVVLTANKAALTARQAHIRVEHLVIGLVDEPDTVARAALLDQGVDLAAVRAAAEAALPPGVDDPPVMVPFDAGSKKVLELAVRESLRLGLPEIGVEHLLLALLENEAGIGLLSGAGADKAAVQAFVAAARG
jgi:hypothetical protein